MLSLDSLILTFSQLHTPALDSIMITLTRMGDLGMIWGILTGVLLIPTQTRRSGVTLILGLSIALILGEGVLKHLIDRPRPFETFSEISLLIPAPLTSSFPSGHTSASWVSALLVTYFFWGKSRLFVILIWILALGVTISRLYLQVHYPTDILGGIVIGGLSAVGAVWIVEKWYSRKTPS